ncbi:MAG: short-chain dehydrogenase [Rhizobacter sp.]|nr:short-chain dehydrogenase [Rhizobacter sp.]
MPVCQDCGTVQYPIRELCGRCLSVRLRFEPVDPQGTLLATTRLHHSNLEAFRAVLPLRIGSIKLDAGPVVLAFLPEGAAPADQRMTVRCELDPDGHAVLVAFLVAF